MKRDEALQKSLENLDISPTMEKNARDKYEALSTYLNNNGINSDFYPQGSFLLGTVIRPHRDGEDKEYDLDVLCLIKKDKMVTTPTIVKTDVGTCIKNSDQYSKKLLKEDDHCWTLEYAKDSSNIGFTLDVVPCVDEGVSEKAEIMLSGVVAEYVFQTVSITNKLNGRYKWLTSNPLGFGRWFSDISDKHLTPDMISDQKGKFSTEFRQIYAKTEEIPHYFYKSNLQRAVQFIKRHRDIFFERIKKSENKPSSILITALVADAVKDIYPLSIEDIIKTFINKFNTNTISLMRDGEILNPVDLREDLACRISEADKNEINKWISSLSALINSKDDLEFRKSIRNNINSSVFEDAFISPKNIVPVKPWSEEE
ncbi:MAG: nucleotidyltransferase [Tissierellia bacterium]|nr:nucleotidyltransferase [Tissierellia bacterium]